MLYINQQNQDDKYGQFARKLLKIATISGSKVVLRHSDEPSEAFTDLVHDFGTTDTMIGDATAEVMITTLGKIPNEMYYLEDTTVNPNSSGKGNTQLAKAVGATTETMKDNNEYSGHSSVLLALLITLLVIFILCCISACLIAKTKRKTTCFGRSNTECDSRCPGINQPLLDKCSDCTNKTSISSLRN